MKIAAGTLFLAVVVFLNSIELISSVGPIETTLAELFHEYERYGYLPDAIPMNTRTAFTTSAAIQRMGSHILRRPDHTLFFLVRAHIIFAWMGYDKSADRSKDFIAPLWQLFPSLEHEEPWVFDTTYNHWVSLSQNEFKKLGFGNIWELVVVQQRTAEGHRLANPNPVINEQAHRMAYLRANQAINMLQVTEAEKMKSGQTSFVESGIFVTRKYIEAYDLVFHETVRDSVQHI